MVLVVQVEVSDEVFMVLLCYKLYYYTCKAKSDTSTDLVCDSRSTESSTSPSSRWHVLLAPCSTWPASGSGSSWKAGCTKWSLSWICPPSSRTTCSWSTEAMSTEEEDDDDDAEPPWFKWWHQLEQQLRSSCWFFYSSDTLDVVPQEGAID